MAGVPGKDAPQVQAQPDPELPGGDAPGGETSTETPAEGAPVEGAETPAAAAPAKPAAAAPAKPAAPAKGAKTAAPAKPAAAAPAKPAAAPAKVEAPVVPAAPAKIKVGDKEYTQEELQEALKKQSTAPAAAAPAAEPTKTKTPEEIAAERAEVRKKDGEWIAKLAPELPVPEISEAQLDTMLAGGKEGIATFKAVLQQAQATAILMTRKSMYAELQPMFDDLRGQVVPLVQSQEEAANEREWQNYITAYPEHKDDKDLVANATMALVQNQPDRLRGLTMQQFQAEVHKEVETFKNRFVPSKIRIGDKEYTKEELEALVAAAPTGGTPAKPAAAAAPAARPAVAAAPRKTAAPARAKVEPPGANLPSATPGKGTKGGSGDKAIIESLW